MLARALRDLWEDPIYLVGADIKDLGDGAQAGHSPVMIVEVDESDPGFRALAPDVIVITGLEHDHPETYPAHRDLVAAVGRVGAGPGVSS